MVVTAAPGWVYVKVGNTEVRGRKIPTGIDIEQVSSSYNKDDFDKAVKLIEEKLREVATPHILTMEEYERDWKPQGWQLIIIGPTSTWRQDWGEWEAIRDIVQNALDETESYRWGYDDKGLWIADTGRGVSVADFLLGPPKIKPDYARGKFGEGMKIAALALVRKGYSVKVETVGRDLWIIFLEQKVNGRAETLAALWRSNGNIRGTKFHIIGYSGPAFERYFAVNLPRSLILAEVPSPLAEPIRRYNQLIRAEGMAASPEGGLIYSRDIYLKDINSPFSYNLWGFELAPDRHGPKNEADLWVDMGRLWCGVSNMVLMERFLEMVLDPPRVMSDETRMISMDTYSMGSDPATGKRYVDLVQESAPAWQKAWRKVAGGNAVIRTTDRWDGMVKHLGYTPVSLQWGVRDALSMVITNDGTLIQESQDRLRETKVLPDDTLTPRAKTHLELARAIATHFGVHKVYASIIPPASDRVRTAGLYDHALEEIILHLETLESAKRTVDAVIHELGHHRAYKTTGDIKLAEDLQPAHSEAMTYVAAKVVEMVADRRFDKYLKEVVW